MFYYPGWGRFGYIPAAAMCGYDYKSSIGNFLFLSGIVLGIPMFVTFFCYGKIGYTLYKSKKNMAAHSQAADQSARKKRLMTIYTMFAISTIFTVMWLPFAVTAALDFLTPIPPIMIRVSAWMGLINSCGNCVVLAIANKNYRAAFRKIFCCVNHQRMGNNTVTVMTESVV